MSSRLESLLQALAEGRGSDIVPGSRIETYLKAIINGDTDVPNPQSRMGAYLHHIAKNGLSGGGSGGSGGSSGGGSGGGNTDTILKDIIEKTVVSLTLPANVTKVSANMFGSCKALTYVDMPNVTNIGDSAFSYCSRLATVILRSTTHVELANSNAFYGVSFYDRGYIYVPAALIDSYKTDSRWTSYKSRLCVLEDNTVDGTINSELSTIKTLISRGIVTYSSDTVTDIGKSAFYYCQALTHVDLPNVTSIGSYAFYYCSVLSSVRLPAIPPTLSSTSAFGQVPTICVFYIPKGSLTEYQNATNWSSLTSTYSFVEEDR
jgi:hypothetical protein